MNKNNLVVIILICVAVFCSLFIFSIVNRKTIDRVKIEAYFPNLVENLIEREYRSISDSDNKKILSDAINILYEGPKSKNLSAFPITNLKVIDIELNDDKSAQINFSNEYNNLNAQDELFFRGSLVWTLTSLDFVDNVIIFVDSQPLKKSDGSFMGGLNRTNVVINPQISDEKTDLYLVKLYFRDKNKLSCEERMININPNQPLERYVLEQIISGPINSDLSATVPPETKIHDIKTDEGICYVSLSGEFANKNNDSESQKFALYSIVNSLTELENINKVQFLIESEKTNQPAWIFDLNKPIERNEKIIKREEK